jgi:phage tail-like protein
MTNDELFFDWLHAAREGDVQRKDGSIVMLDHRGYEVMRWNFFSALPIKWDGPDLKAEGSSLVIEALELIHEGIESVA